MLTAGTHLIKASATDGCNATGTASVTVFVNPSPGLDSPESSLVNFGNSPNETEGTGFDLIPNPARDHLDMHVSGQLRRENISIRIMDVQGKILLQQHKAANTSYLHRLDISQLTPGLYLIVVTSENGTTETQKWIKQ